MYAARTWSCRMAPFEEQREGYRQEGLWFENDNISKMLAVLKAMKFNYSVLLRSSFCTAALIVHTPLQLIHGITAPQLVHAYDKNIGHDYSCK